MRQQLELVFEPMRKHLEMQHEARALIREYQITNDGRASQAMLMSVKASADTAVAMKTVLSKADETGATRDQIQVEWTRWLTRMQAEIRSEWDNKEKQEKEERAWADERADARPTGTYYGYTIEVASPKVRERVERPTSSSSTIMVLDAGDGFAFVELKLELKAKKEPAEAAAWFDAVGPTPFRLRESTGRIARIARSDVSLYETSTGTANERVSPSGPWRPDTEVLGFNKTRTKGTALMVFRVAAPFECENVFLRVGDQYLTMKLKSKQYCK